ncbi:MAG: ABC transporter ATP-binding protein [Firmicutes bacterium]|jgi:branched-chain amino acid transport system ATP-binding protein|nr:ABC transporter ATP-binding protein [Bacillota bacterium]
MLEVEGLKASYGGITALHGISFRVEAGEVVSLIGANGAGKTTTLKCISGVVRPVAGAIRFAGRDITGLPPHEIARAGLMHVPEGRRVFSLLTVRENLLTGGFLAGDASAAKRNMEKVLSLFPVLGERMAQLGGTLSGGEQQMLAIARALMASPKLLLLDEPSMGLAPVLVERIFDTIHEIAKDGIPILLVEQNAGMALETSNRAYVMERGRIVMEGPAGLLAADRRIREAYLGGGGTRG